MPYFLVDFTEEENIDLKLSNMTINKYVIHPFISIPKDVGISVTSLVSPKDSRHLEIFESCANNLEMVRNKTKEFAYMDTHANC